MLKIIIVEDNKLTVELIVNILESCKDVEIVGIAGDIDSGLQIITENSPDLVLFDINLPGGTSFDILQKLDYINFKFVFITAYDKYALRAIKLSALDYLLKPVNSVELINVVKKAKLLIKNESSDVQISALQNNMQNSKNENEKIVLKTFECIYLIAIKDIVRCESGGAYTFFYLKDEKRITVSRLLKEYDELLKDQGFYRVHQSHLVNINYIDRFDKKQGGFLIMKDGASVPVSYRKKDNLLKMFSNYS
jgi:two-component system LytT family response regulator